jgi:hypothetical protein
LLPKDSTSIEVEFDRKMKINSGYGGSVSFRCEGSVQDIDLPTQDLILIGQLLIISVQTLIASYTGTVNRECELHIANGLFADLEGVEYLGLGKVTQDTYSFEISDMVAPQVSQYDPAQGSTIHDALVTITFSEEVALKTQLPQSVALQGSLRVLEESSRSTTLDRIYFPMTSPRVMIQREELWFDLSGLVESGKLYSLTIPPNVVFDHAANPFAGLGTGISDDYLFRTAPAAVVVARDIDEEDTMSEALVFFAIAAMAFTGLLCALATWRIYRIQRKRGRRLGEHAAVESSQSEKVNASLSPLSTGKLQRGPSNVSVPSPKAQPPLGSEHISASRSAASHASASSSPSVAAGQTPLRHAATASFGESKEWAKQTTDAQRRWQEARAASKTTPLGNFGKEKSSRKVSAEPSDGDTKAASTSTNSQSGGGKVNEQGKATSSGPSAGSSPSKGGATSSSRGRAASAETSRSSKTTRQASKENFFHTPPPKVNPGSPKDADGGNNTPLSVESADSQVGQLQKQIERRMRDAMDAPLADRKKLLKELMFEYHPDKNNAPDAKQIFQTINASKSWFITES